MTETELLEILARGEDSRCWGVSRRPTTGAVQRQIGIWKRAGAADG